jgi:hypothetical protein
MYHAIARSVEKIDDCSLLATKGYVSEQTSFDSNVSCHNMMLETVIALQSCIANDGLQCMTCILKLSRVELWP